MKVTVTFPEFVSNEAIEKVMTAPNGIEWFLRSLQQEGNRRINPPRIMEVATKRSARPGAVVRVRVECGVHPSDPYAQTVRSTHGTALRDVHLKITKRVVPEIEGIKYSARDADPEAATAYWEALAARQAEERALAQAEAKRVQQERRQAWELRQREKAQRHFQRAEQEQPRAQTHQDRVADALRAVPSPAPTTTAFASAMSEAVDAFEVLGRGSRRRERRDNRLKFRPLD